MIRLMLTIIFLFIGVLSYSQQEQEILINALQNYKEELPMLEKRAFKELKKLNKNNERLSKEEFKKLHFIIIPMFKLKETYMQYHIGDSNTLANIIDFIKIHDDFEAFVFKDSIYKGSLHFSDYDNSYFSVKDTNKYNKPAFKGQLNLVSQIMSFNPDMVFYPDCPVFLCFIKEGKLYIGKGAKQLQTLDYILPFDEFIKKNPTFIKELQENKNPKLNHYIELQ
jgi:hypothetical protein